MSRTFLAVGVVAALLSAASAAPAPARAADSWRSLTYGGERFEVPSTWPVLDLAADPSQCVRFDRHAVYEGQVGPDPSCPPQLLGVSEAVQVAPLDALALAQVGPDLRAATIGGQAARTTQDEQTAQRLVAEFPGAGVMVTISYGTDPALAQAILASFRAVTPARSALTPARSAVTRARSAVTPAQDGPGPAPTAATPATATPATTPGVAVGPVSWTGLAFDACTAPGPSAMAAWRQSSSYLGVGVYIGGINRACGDGYLSSSWVNEEVAAGWHLVPLYVGRQAACADQAGLAPISESGSAGLEGVQAAQDAVNQAVLFGMGAGSPIYFDMEAWNTSDATCSASVASFVAAWDQELGRLGFVSGIYGSSDGGLAQAIAPLYARSGLPRDVDFGEWDGQANTASAYLPATDWADHHRIKQFEGGVNQTHGGVTINIDQDYVDSDVVGNEQPAVSAVSPAAAPVGRSVVVVGQAFVPGRTEVSFGGVPSRRVTVASPYRLLARVPSRSVTTVDVTVTTPGGTSLTGPADRFRYVPVVGVAADQATGGYWVTTAAGNVSGFDAPFHGSAAATTLSSAVVGMAADPATGGYWLVTAGGNVLPYGAPFYGSPAGRALPAPVVGIAADPATGGYRLVTAKGNVYNFGAPFYGSLAGRALPAPVVGIAADPATGGYWLVTGSGRVSSFHAVDYGAGLTAAPPSEVISITAAGAGYLLATASGNIYNFATPFDGSLAAG